MLSQTCKRNSKNPKEKLAEDMNKQASKKLIQVNLKGMSGV